MISVKTIQSSEAPFRRGSFSGLLLFLRRMPCVNKRGVLGRSLSCLGPRFRGTNYQRPGVVSALCLSSLLFPRGLRRRLSGSSGLRTSGPGGPMGSSLGSLLLFRRRRGTFRHLSDVLGVVCCKLLRSASRFNNFFSCVSCTPSVLSSLSNDVLRHFDGSVYVSSPLTRLVASCPIRLTCNLSLVGY